MSFLSSLQKIFGLGSTDSYDKSEHSRTQSLPLSTQSTSDSPKPTQTPAPTKQTETTEQKTEPQLREPKTWSERKLLLKKAILYTIARESVSCSMLQREFRIGFSLAGRLLENMEHFYIIRHSEKEYSTDYTVIRTYISNEEMGVILNECNMEPGIDIWNERHQDIIREQAKDYFVAVAKYVIARMITDTELIKRRFDIYETSIKMILDTMVCAGMLGRNTSWGSYYPLVDETSDLHPYLVKGLSMLPKTHEQEEEEAELRREILAEEEKRKESVRRHERKMELRKRMAEQGEISAQPSRYIPQEIREAVLARDGYRCVKCGSTQYLEVDHILPYSLGGTNELSNLQTLCRKCNSEKSNKLM